MSEVKSALQVLEGIGSTGSRTEKENTLREAAGNKVLQGIFQLTYGDQRYNVYPDENCNTVSKRVAGTEASRWKAFQKVCADLAAKKVTGGKAYNSIFTFLKSCPTLENKWYRRVLGRDLEVSVGKTIISKIWPSLLTGDSSFNKCMLASQWDPKIFQEPFELWCEPKMDGLRVVTVIDEQGKATLYTRGGKVVSHLMHIKAAIEKLGVTSRMLDGEMVVYDETHTHTDWRRTLSLAKPRIHISAAMAKEIVRDVEYHIFDTLPLKYYQKPKAETNIPLKKRRARLRSILKEVTPPLVLVKKIVCTSLKSIDSYYAKCLDAGYEGVIVKDPEGMYIADRIWAWQKIKPTRDKSGKIVGYQIGAKRHDEVDPKLVKKVIAVLSKMGKVSKTKSGYRIPYPGSDKAGSLLSKLEPDLKQRISISEDDKWLRFRTVPRVGALEIKPEGSKETIKVGTGFSDELRAELWDKQDEYMGQWIDYLEQKDAGDTGKTRFCRFVRFRVKGEK